MVVGKLLMTNKTVESLALVLFSCLTSNSVPNCDKACQLALPHFATIKTLSMKDILFAIKVRQLHFAHSAVSLFRCLTSVTHCDMVRCQALSQLFSTSHFAEVKLARIKRCTDCDDSILITL